MVEAAPLSREARKAETREAIVAAATKLFARKGIEATSLDRIAKEVGLTKGAIYSTFESKVDLVEAVALATSISIEAKYLLDPDLPLLEGLKRLGAEVMETRKRFVEDSMILHLELMLYERRHRKWGERVQEQVRTGLEQFADQLEAAVEVRGERLPLPVREFGYALRALALGIALELEENPDALTKESVIELFAALAD